MRISKDEHFLKIADVISERATCDRLKVGSVIVKNGAIISTGYNGAPRQLDHCDDVGHMIRDNHCIRVVHAEINCLLSAARLGGGTHDAILYCNYQPCWECFKAIVNAGISKVVYRLVYKMEDPRVVEAASITGITLLKVSTEHME